MVKPYRAKYETRHGCALCGYSPAMGIHSPVLSGPRKGQPWGHAYVPKAAATTKPKEKCNED